MKFVINLRGRIRSGSMPLAGRKLLHTVYLRKR